MRFFRFLSIFLLAGVVCICSLCGQAQSVDRAQVEKEIDALWDQIKAKEPLLFEVSSEDKERHAEFLARPETGIIRLLPRERFDGKLKIRGGGAYYSFSRLTHEYGYGVDIGLERDHFQVGFYGYSFGFFAEAGLASLDEVTLDHPALKFLLNFSPALTESEIRIQQRQAGEGIKAGEFSYRSRAPVNVGHTYVLRSIDYDKTDVLIAFQVLRRDEDGSVVLIWKILKKFSPPRPERPKQN
jgi:hypothetical protein